MLYGNLEAKNSEIVNVATVSNCTEFIDKGKLDSLDDTPGGLLKEIENNKNAYISLWGQEEYDKNLETMKKVKEQHDSKGEFQAIDGDVDTRSKDKWDVNLH